LPLLAMSETALAKGRKIANPLNKAIPHRVHTGTNELPLNVARV